MTHSDGAGSDRFDPARVRLDHIGFGCQTEQEVHDWAAVMDDRGIPHGPIENVPYAVVVTGRDPDDIPVEFYWFKLT